MERCGVWGGLPTHMKREIKSIICIIFFSILSPHLKMIQFTVCWCFHFPAPSPPVERERNKRIVNYGKAKRTMAGESNSIGNVELLCMATENYGPRMTESHAEPLNNNKSLASSLAREIFLHGARSWLECRTSFWRRRRNIKRESVSWGLKVGHKWFD